MTSTLDTLLESSIHAALSAIEVYNKPVFKYREQAFVVLIVNAWELLLKRKIALDAGDRVESLYVSLPDGTFKQNRSRNPLTIDILTCMSRLSIDNRVAQNIESLVDIRDTVIHFYSSEPLSSWIYRLAVASLKNYQRLISEWFDRSLLEYNFFILPLGFAYNFQRFSLMDVAREPEAVQNILRAASERSGGPPDDTFHFACEVNTEVRSVKKWPEGADFTTAIDSTTSTSSSIFIRTQSILDRYPLSYRELLTRIRAARPSVKQSQVDQIIKDHQIKQNDKYSTYNFRTKKQWEEYNKSGKLPKAVPSIYADDAVRFIAGTLDD